MPSDTKINIRTITTKFDTHMKRSGEVSQGLRPMPEAAERYEQVQQSERRLRGSKEELDARAAAHAASTARVDAGRKQLMSVIKAYVAVCGAFGLDGARTVLVSDVSDEPALAAHVAEYARQIPDVGPALAQGLLAKRSQWLASEAAHQDVLAEFELAARCYAQAFYKATAVVAEGKALLAVSGQPVPGRKVTRKKKPALTIVPPAATPPQSTSTPSEEATPAPTPIVG